MKTQAKKKTEISFKPIHNIIIIIIIIIITIINNNNIQITRLKIRKCPYFAKLSVKIVLYPIFLIVNI